MIPGLCLFLRLGSGSEFLLGQLHLLFIFLARFLPGVIGEWHTAFPLALALVLTGMRTATALPLAVIRRVAGVSLRRRAVSLTGAFVLCPFTLGFTGVESPAHMRLLKKQRGVVLGTLLSRKRG